MLQFKKIYINEKVEMLHVKNIQNETITMNNSSIWSL